MPLIDTLSAVEELTAVKVPKQQAKKIVEIMSQSHDDLVTNSNLSQKLSEMEMRLTWRMLAVAGLLFAALRFTG